MSEIEEAQRLLEQATFPGIKSVLSNYITSLKRSAESSTATVAPSPSPTANPVATVTPSVPKRPAVTGHYIPIEDFAWDQGGFNSETITIFVDLPGVGKVKQNCEIRFGKHSLDLLVHGLDGKNYRLIKENLEKDIVPEKSSMIVKANKIVLKLQKVKGEYSFENWNNLTAKKPRTHEDPKKKDPMGGIMDMMKDMYEDGDENMKKIIGEAMMKSQRGERSDPPAMGDL